MALLAVKSSRNKFWDSGNSAIVVFLTFEEESMCLTLIFFLERKENNIAGSPVQA